jgi:hypothetical protein
VSREESPRIIQKLAEEDEDRQSKFAGEKTTIKALNSINQNGKVRKAMAIFLLPQRKFHSF